MDTPAETLAILRTRIGLADDDTSRDVMLDLGWQAALDWAEDYCDRDFRGGDRTESILLECSDRISLRSYFVDAITAISDDDGKDVAYRTINRPSGLVRLQSPFDGELTVEYTAAPVMRGPAFLALLGAFDAAFATLTGEAGSGEVKSTSIDGMRVDFVTDAQTSSELGGLPENVAGLLAPFRRMYC